MLNFENIFPKKQAFSSSACILPLLWPPPHKGEPESWKSVVDNLLLLYHRWTSLVMKMQYNLDSLDVAAVSTV